MLADDGEHRARHALEGEEGLGGFLHLAERLSAAVCGGDSGGGEGDAGGVERMAEAAIIKDASIFPRTTPT
jgi:hypothetical protein